MLLIEYYPSIIGEDFLDYAKNPNWNLLHACIDAHIQILIDEYQVYVAQAIIIFQSQSANMTFDDNSRCNKMFQQVVHKEGESEINYINRFQNVKALIVLVGNSYS